ncbi:FAD-binding domain-containing protein [Trametes versicolor FP-101664 SS1]|uniref:FAD-binding domain-containing protein n=1 Tax=Trametes versicolor (strain FP-101664) TaxID=717944 RepID=R7S6M5_TRAVS|nr:FAD-binding domain-containing protein [Trametes versicolor FP-101664 SS1]EIW51598.1 FAD-binding domain-containing protein [Trametes versicolor FP-101664 SS1]
MADLQSKIQGTILTPESGDAYTAALRRNSDLSILPAKLVVQPAVFEDIPSIIAYATGQTPPLEIAVKGGGAHSATWASSDGGVVIDLGKLNKVTLAEDKQSVSVQGGALWGDVYEVTSKAQVDVVGSPLWFVGVGGYTLGGGYGPLSGEYGLAIDNILSATVVLADGRIVKTSKDEEPDLFWAIRGGGGQFGIVVEFVFKTHPYAGPFGSGVIAFPGTELASILQIIKVEWKATHTPAERFTLNFSRPAPHFKPSIVFLPSVLHDTDGARSKTVLAPFREGAVKPAFEKIATVPDFLTVSHAADASLASAPKRLAIRGTFFSDFYPELLQAVWDKWVAFTETSEEVRGSAVLWDLTSPAKLTEVGADETALKVREPHYWMAVQGRSTTDASVDAARAFTADVVQLVREKNTELSGRDLGWFVNLSNGTEKAEDVFGANLPRLRKIKAKYDPKKVWSKGFVIEPLLE